MIFMISGFAIYFTLPRILSTDDFGNYGVVVGFLSVFNMMLVVGTIQAVSKFVSEKPGQEPRVRQAAFRLQACVGGGTTLILLLGADLFARLFFQDPQLAWLIRIGAFMPVLYAFYSVVMGSFNGRKLYHKQATLDMTFALLKTGLIISGAWIAGSVHGAIGGFTVTGLVIMIIGLNMLRRSSADNSSSLPSSQGIQPGFTSRRLLAFQASVMILTLLSNLLINMDLFMVKALSPAMDSSAAAGLYTAVQTFARIPYVLVVALALVMFPLISDSTSSRNLEQSQKYIRGAFRFPLVIIAPVAIFISVYSRQCIGVVYPESYLEAAPVLMILALAELLLAMFYLATAVINGSGRPGVSIVGTVIAIICHVSACQLLIPRHGIVGAAWGSVIGWSIGFLVCAIYLFRQFKTLVKLNTVLRSVPAMVATWWIVSCLTLEGIMGLIIGFVATLVAYWGLLLIVRELSISELRSILNRLK